MHSVSVSSHLFVPVLLIAVPTNNKNTKIFIHLFVYFSSYEIVYLHVDSMLFLFQDNSMAMTCWLG